ncbi:MAG: hypothetical protein WEB07_02325 [Natronospirillum sp.]
MALKGVLNWRWSAGILLIMAMAAATLYWSLGAQQAIALYEVAQTRDRSAADFDRYLSALEDHVKQQSDPALENLYRLAEGYSESGRYEQALGFYDRTEAALRAQAEYDPQELSIIVASRGQIRFILADRELTSAVEADFAEALRLDPLNDQALATLGVAHFDAGNYHQAIAIWQRFLEVAPPGRTRNAVVGALDQARRITGETLSDGTEAPGVQVLFSALPEDLDPAALVYIVARPVDAELPVAIQRYTAADLPLALRLTDLDRSPDMAALSGEAEVDVVAFVTPPDAPDLTQASHRSDVVRAPTTGNAAVVTLTLTRRD